MRRKLVLLCCLFVMLCSGGIALAQRALPNLAPHAQATPTPAPIAPRVAGRVRRLPPLPPIPRGTAKIRRVQSATGACIVFSFNAGCAAAGNVNENFVAGATIAWNAAVLPASGSHQDYVLVPGNAAAPTSVGTVYAGATGPNESQANVINGIYVFATLNTTTNAWDAISYVLVGSVVSIETFSDGTLANKIQTFTTSAAGTASVFVAARGLYAQDAYAIGIEDQLTGKCVFTSPSSAQTSPPTTLCRLDSATLTGTNPTGSGLLLANWGATLATSPALPQAGTFVASVFDQSTGQRVASRLFSIVDARASANGSRVLLGFHNGAGTTSAAASVARIAYNGTATQANDPSQTYMTLYFGGTSMPMNPPNSDSYSLVVTDPTGTVAKTFSGVQTAYGTTGISSTNNQWNLPTQSIPFETAYPGNTWTATIYDTTANKFMAAQSFQILGYSASVLFQNPTSQTINISTGNSVSSALQFTNTGDNVFGPNNGDPLTKFVASTSISNYKFTNVSMQPPGANTACSPTTSTPCNGTYSDSAGNTWNVVLATTGGGSPDFSFTITPSGTTVALGVGQSVTLSGLTFTGTACTGTGGCLFFTSITAQDMLPGYSSPNSSTSNVVNGVSITEGAATVTATASAKLVGYYDSANAYHVGQDAGYTPRFNQVVFAQNQPFTGAASKIVFAYTVNNTSTYQIQIFGLYLPSAFNTNSITVDSHTPSGATVSSSGYCNGVPNTTACVTPSTVIAANSSQTYYFSVTPPSSSFSYTDLAGTIIQSAYNGYSYYPVTITPASTSVQTFIGNPTKVDSTALGAYSLSGGLMTGGLTPGSIGTNTTNTLTYNLHNTPTSSDPFPDEVDFVALSIPNQTYVTVPTSCSGLTVATSGWSCVYATSGTSQPTVYYFGQCAQQVAPVPTLPATASSFGSDNLTVCPFAAPNEPYSLAPGAVLSVNVPVTSGATQTPGGSPIAINSYAHGATTDAWTTPIASTLAVSATAAAGVGFYSIGAPGGGVANVPQGTQPQIVGNYNAGSNTYVYKIKNTGGISITAATIAIPGPDTTGTNGQDASGNIWKVTGTPVLTDERTGNANGCTQSFINPASGLDTAAKISIVCPAGNFIGGDTLDIQFVAIAPLKINSTYNFATTINGAATGVAPNWYADTQILIALSATISVAVNNAASCPAQVALSAPNSTVNFGIVAANTNVACPDAMIVTVVTDAANPANWSLYVSADANPARTGAGATNELLIQTDTTNSTAANSVPCPSGITAPCFAYDSTAAYTPVGVTSSGAGTRLAYSTQGGTGVNNGSVKIYVNYEVSIGTEAVPTTGHQQTITYTWIAN